MTEQSSNPRLDAIIAEYLHKTQPTESDRERLISQNPDLTDDLRSFFADHDQVAHAADEATIPPSNSQLEDPTIPPSSAVEDTATLPPAASSSGTATVGTKVRYFGDYELLEEIARGGMGVVYKAKQTSLNRIVALKMILAGQLAGEEDVQRFHAEAEAAANLDHPGIVPIYEIGEHAGQHYFSMGYVEGESLADKIKDGPLPPREAAEYTKKIAEAVAFAHENGVIHRDLKPANVLLDKNGEPKVTDFGLAKKLEGDSGLTATGQILGTPSYMPPEQASGKLDEVTETADVYSLGAILYALLTGRPMFQADNHLDTLMQVLEKEPVSPRHLNDRIPRDLETIVLKCLNKDQSHRYDAATSLREELHRFLNDKPILARPISRTMRAWRWCRRNPSVAGLIVTVVTVLLVGSVVSSHFAIKADAQAQRAVAEKDRANDRAAEAVAEKARADMKAAEALAEKNRANEETEIARRNLYAVHMSQVQAAWEDDRMPAASKILEYYAPGTGSESLRGFEWYYWRKQCHSYLTNMEGHREPVVCVAFSPASNRIATGGLDRCIRVWDSLSGSELMRMTGNSGEVLSLAFSADGKWIASGSADRKVKIWDVQTGANVKTLKKSHGSVMHVGFSTDGMKLLAVGRDRILVWDTENWELSRSIAFEQGLAISVAVSSDQSRLAIADANGVIRIWAIDGGQLISKQETKRGPLSSIAFSPDATKLATASLDRKVHITDVATGELLTTISRHQGFVNCLVFSHDGKRLVSGSDDRTAKIWDSTSGDLILTLNGHTAGVHDVKYNPDGTRLASASADGTIKLWESDQSQEALTMQGHTSNHLSFSANGEKLISGNRAGQVRLWDATTGQEIATVGSKVYRLSPNGTYLALADKKAVRILDGSTGELLRVLKSHDDEVHSLSYSSDGTRLVSASRGTSTLWDATTYQEIATLRGGRPRFSPDGRWLGLSTNDFLKIYDTRAGELTLTLKDRFAGEVVFSFDSNLFAARASKSIKVWSIPSGKEVQSFSGYAGKVLDIRFSSDGTRLLTIAREQFMVRGRINPNRTATLWDIKGGKKLRALDGQYYRRSSIAFSPDGNLLVTADDPFISIWNVKSGKQIRKLKGHEGRVHSIVFSPDGTRLASASADRTLKLWDVSTGLEVTTFRGHSHDVTHLTFAPNGQCIASAEIFDVVKIWHAPKTPELEQTNLVVSPSEYPGKSKLKTVGGEAKVNNQQRSSARNVTINNSIGMQLVLIKADGFLMGASEHDRETRHATPQHSVIISRDFYMGATEVTHGQWNAVMLGNIKRKQSKGQNQDQVIKGANYPISEISWSQAVAFCTKLSQLENQTYRLPTEAEWEFCCRAGTVTDFSFGDDVNRLGDFAWFRKNAPNNQVFTCEVGTKAPNPWGLYDMHGSVSEWCQDWFRTYEEAEVTDPIGPSTGRVRVIRGGSWESDERQCRSAFRSSGRPVAQRRGRIVQPATRGRHLGFRVVREIPTEHVAR